MMENDCKFKCAYLKDGECQQGGGECLEGDCPEWGDCENCKTYNDCADNV